MNNAASGKEFVKVQRRAPGQTFLRRSAVQASEGRLAALGVMGTSLGPLEPLQHHGDMVPRGLRRSSGGPDYM